MTRKTARRNTKQRQVILEELQRLKSHPSAAELYEAVRGRVPNISLGTVYRNLDLLAEVGKIRKLSIGQAEARFDARTDAHYHVSCVECGRLDDVEDVSPDLGDHSLQSTKGFEIIGHQLQFIGICPDCRARGKEIGSRNFN